MVSAVLIYLIQIRDLGVRVGKPQTKLTQLLSDRAAPHPHRHPGVCLGPALAPMPCSSVRGLHFGGGEKGDLGILEQKEKQDCKEEKWLAVPKKDSRGW